MPLSRRPRAETTDLAALQQELNQLFERLAEFDRADHPAEGEWIPSVDIYECRGSLMVVVEVPGLSPEALRVAHADGRLIITGERRDRKPAGGAFLCMERPQGRFTRTILLDEAVDIRQAEAAVSGGLLTITIPRVKDRRGHETVIAVRRDDDGS
jgi:HSP20 family molecular chaperone IbpA